MNTALKLILFLVLAICLFSLNAQQYQWTYHLGSGSQLYYAPVLGHDSQGNLIVAGRYQGKLDFDPGTGVNMPTGKIYVAKLSPKKELLWVTPFLTDQLGPEDLDVAVDHDDNIILWASYYKHLYQGKDTLFDFDHFPVKSFMAKLNGKDGVLQFVRSVGDPYSEGWTKPTKIAIGEEDEILLTGYYTKSVAFDPGNVAALSHSKGETDIFIARYDKDGHYQWTRTIGNSEYDYAFGIASDENGDVVVAGYFYYTTDIDEGPDEVRLVNQGGADIFLLKLSKDNQIIWAKSIGSAGSDTPSDVQIDKDGNILISGHFRARIDFDPGPGMVLEVPFGGYDVFAAKYTAEGEYLWHRIIGSVNNEFASNNFIDNAGNFYVFLDNQKGLNQTFSNGVKINTNFLANMVVVKFDINGEPVQLVEVGSDFEFMNGGSFPLHGHDLTVTGNGLLFYSAAFAYSMDVDPTDAQDSLTALGSVDNFISCVRLCDVVYGYQKIASAQAFALSDGRLLYDTGRYTDTLTAHTGCDSIVTIDFRRLNPGEVLDEVILLPNPVEDEVFLLSGALEGAVRMKVFAADGRLVEEKNLEIQAKTRHTLTAIFGHIPAATYIVVLEFEGAERAFKMVRP